MYRATILFCSLIFLASSLPGICQGIPGYHPANCFPPKPIPRGPQVAPIVRTMQVNVPAPCPPPIRCGPMGACSPSFRCPPPCPTRPVRVRVEVVVRPEARKPCVPQRYCCENPPVFEPILCRAAGMLRSMVLAPLGLGECILGHGVPRVPCPPPIPVACPPCRVAPCPRPPLPCVMPYQRPVPVALHRPKMARSHGYVPRPVRRGHSNAPFPR